MTKRPILLVEDRDDDVRLTKRALQRNNITNPLVVVNDGEEAMRFLRAAAHPGPDQTPLLPAVVLLDLKLPKLDGIEVLRQIRADPALHRQPVVILTTSKEEQDIIRSYDLGANSYIRKPVEFDQFCSALSQLGLYWLILNEPPPEPSAAP
ncbi:MAG TPA: response regulator [Opitutaceae bacterium]|nr:response regulator [Opitutaceae bacterium]